jgi:hypothetical protein
MGSALRADGAGTKAASGREPAGSRRPWWIWVTPFTTLFVVLVARNAFLFSTKLYEQGDSGANSILIQQALRFRLLVGHYSREKFNHPGPVYLYAQAWGQWLARDVLHVVPTDWNGQFFGIYAIDCAMVMLTVAVVYGITRSIACAAGVFCVLLGFAAWHPDLVTGNWMPYLLVMTFLVFLLAAASVAARQSRDLWVLALSGCMLIHGYAPNLLFVPLIVLAAAATALWPQRRHLVQASTEFVRDRPRAWISAVLICVVFALPIVINTLLHWPGEFGKYIAYDNSRKAGGHTATQVVHYVLWFWWPHNRWVAVAVAVALIAVAIAVAMTLTSGQLRRWMLALVAFDVLTTLAFSYYAATGIDGLAYYIGYFYWAVPASLAVVIVAGLISAAPDIPATATTLVTLATVALVAFGVFAQLRSNTHDNDPGLPGAVATLAAHSHGKPIVITGTGQSWVEIPGFLVQAERTGVTACVSNPSMAYLVSQQMICTQQERDSGVPYTFGTAAPRPGTPVIVRFGTSQFGYANVTQSH